MHQRSVSQTTGPVPLAGTFSGGTLLGVEAQVLLVSDNSVVKDWTAISGGSIGGGAWSGTLAAVPQGGPYYCKVRASNATSVGATGATGWYMGIVFVCYGQSNMGGLFGVASSAPSPSAGTVYYDTSSGWGLVAATGASAGNGIAEFLNAVRSSSGVPCGALSGAIAGTDIDFLENDSPTDYVDGGGLWRYYQILAAAGVTDAEMVLWHQGEGSAGRSELSYKTLFSSMHTKFCTLFGRSKSQLPLVLAGLTTYGDTDGVNTDEAWSTIRTAHIHAAQEQTNVHFSHSNMDGVRTDTYHLDGTSQGRAGKRYARTVNSLLGLGGAEAHFELVSGATVDATHTNLTLALASGATDFTPTSGITGFQVSGDNGATWVTPSAAARTDATHIALTHSSLATTNVRKVRYQYGMLPDVSSPLKDNSSLALPLTYTADDITPTPLSTIPVPTYRGSAATSGSLLVQTVTFEITPSTQQLLIASIAGKAGAGNAAGPNTVVFTPNVGTAVTATEVVSSNDASGGVGIYQAQLLSDANTATQVDVTWTTPSNPFGDNRFSLWSVASATLSSTTATGIGHAKATTSAAASTTVNVSAGGFIIAADHLSGSSSATAVFSGTGTFAMRKNNTATIRTAAGDVSGCSANASSSVVCTWSDATADNNIVAAAWR